MKPGLKLARDEFTKLVNDREMKDACVLIYANKQDLKDAMTAKEIPEIPWSVQPSCVVTGDGLEPGLDWILEETKKLRKLRKIQAKQSM